MENALSLPFALGSFAPCAEMASQWAIDETTSRDSVIRHYFLDKAEAIAHYRESVGDCLSLYLI